MGDMTPGAAELAQRLNIQSVKKANHHGSGAKINFENSIHMNEMKIGRLGF